MNAMTIRTARKQKGFSLVEVLIAMAILGVILVAIMSLFVMGRRNVYSGKQTTRAIALGNRVLEDLSLLTKRDIYNGAFSIADTGTGSSVTLLGTTYANARIRSTNPNIIASAPSDISTETTPSTTPPGPQFLTNWTTQLGTALGPNGSVSLVMQPLEDTTNTPAQFGTAKLLRLTVVVVWNEAKRQRNIVVSSVKAY
jgi:prepilin-type N-terminal cleavage/methylation domain-containing protein